jgi:hypothetical protein
MISVIVRELGTFTSLSQCLSFTAATVDEVYAAASAKYPRGVEVLQTVLHDGDSLASARAAADEDRKRVAREALEGKAP